MRTLMSHERSELTYPSETVPPIQAGFATAMNRPLCSFVSAMRFGAPQRQDIEKTPLAVPLGSTLGVCFIRLQPENNQLSRR